jgi:hypothetical protein
MLGFLNENHKAACRLLDSPRTSITGVAAAWRAYTIGVEGLVGLDHPGAGLGARVFGL